MGLVLDNQKHVSIKHIIEFKENLRVIIISSIFILLAARLQISDFEVFNLAGIAFLGLLIFIARPLSVFVSTLFSDLNWRERTFISWLAPRGIVAAAVSSVFALKLAETGIPGSESIVPITFIVIIVTVGIYGLTSPVIAKWLKVAQSDPQGVLIVGAHAWAIEIAKILVGNKIRVVLVDTNYTHISNARLEGLTAYQGSILSEHLINEVDLNGIGRMMALTSNDEANSLAALHLREEFESGELYQLPPLVKKNGNKSEFSAKHLRARFLFKDGMNYSQLNKLFLSGWLIKSTRLTEEFTYEDFIYNYNNNVVLLFWLNENNKLGIATVENDFKPAAGHKIIALVKET
jgi:FlaA1/EpsC-like NDP-sugar epimerase